MSIKHLISFFALAFSAATAACSDSPTGVPNPAPDTVDLDSEPAETRNETTSDEVADGVAVETVDEVADGVAVETVDEVADGVAVETVEDVADGVAVETVDEVADGVAVETVEEVSDAVDGDTADVGPCQSDAECDTGICDDGVCVGCDDGITNGDETDVDCGGPDCGACAVGDVCSDDDDCGGRRCLLGTCRSRPASSIAVGRAHACAIVTGGRIVCWGDNTHGQCGIAGGAASVAPTLVGDGDFDGFEKIAAGARHTCAARGGELFCWGDNGRGQVGPATPLAAGLPPTRFAQQPYVQSVEHIALGDAHTCVTNVAEDDYRQLTICWGDNRFGQAGVGEVSDTPMPPTSGTGRLARVDELRAGRNHTCARGIYASSGNNLTSVMCWGDNVHRQADPDPYLDADVITSPVEASVRASTYQRVAGGGDTSCFVRNQRIECWGDLQAFGINTPTHSVSVGSWDDVWKMAISDVALCVVRWDDSVECIGATGGDMALSPTEARSIVGLEGPMSDVQLGYDFACARGQDGLVRCWGDNTHGQLGRAAPSSSPSAFAIDL